MKTPQRETTPALVRSLGAVLAAGLALRLLLLLAVTRLDTKIVDEQHYRQLAASVLHGDGFAWAPGRLTSIRPPLYPFFVAGLWWLTGTESLQWVRMVQIAISLLSVLLVYRLGILLYGRTTALLAAAMFCFYPALVFFDYLILTEVLFTFLLTVVVLGYIHLLRGPKALTAWCTGAALGFASLTRSILWPLPLLLCPFALVTLPGSIRRRVAIAGLLLAGHVMVLAPWAIRNTRLQGVFTVVDTMGGINLRCGNYEYTPQYRMWDAIALTGEKDWSYDLRREHPDVSTWTEGQKDQWAQRKAVAFIRANPLLTLQRSLIRFADFWGPERVFLGGLRQQLYAPPVWFAVLAGTAIVVSHLLVMLLALLGAFLAAPRDGRAHAFLLLIVLFVCGIHTLVFGHPRYQLPLVPILILYAASATSTRCWRRLREGFSTAAAPLAALAILLIIWVRQAWIELPVVFPRLIAASADASGR